jgi:hypothetical protein
LWLAFIGLGVVPDRGEYGVAFLKSSYTKVPELVLLYLSNMMVSQAP